MKCSKCGGNIESGSKFCKFCGKKIIKKKIKSNRVPKLVISVAVILIIIAVLMWGVVIYAMVMPTGYAAIDNSLEIYPDCLDSEINKCENKEYTITDLSVKTDCVETKDGCLKYLLGLCVKKKTVCAKKLVTCGVNLNNYGESYGDWKIKFNLLSGNDIIGYKIRAVNLDSHSSTKNRLRNPEEEFCGMRLTNSEEEKLKREFDDIGVIVGFSIEEEADKQLGCSFEVLSEPC